MFTFGIYNTFLRVRMVVMEMKVNLVWVEQKVSKEVQVLLADPV